MLRIGYNFHRFRRYISSKFSALKSSPVIEATPGSKKEILKKSMEIVAGLESELRNPDALLNKKNVDLTLYDTLMLDDTIKFVIDLKKSLVLHIPSKVIAASDDEKDIEIAEAFQSNLDNLTLPSWHDALHNLLDSMIYGHKEGEIVWGQNEEGLWVWDKLKFQHPILFDFQYDKDKNLKYVAYGRKYGNDKEIPAEEFFSKFLYLVNPYLKDGNYYGDSDLREVYFDWWSKFNIERWRNTYLQGYGMPIPVVKYVSKEMTTDELNNIDAILERWQDQMFLKIPGSRHPETKEIQPKFEIDWIELNTKSGTDQYNSTINEIKKAIMHKLLLPDKLGFSDDKAGSFAQSKKIFDILIINIKEVQTRLEEVMPPHIKRFVDWNFPNVDEYPVWRFEEIDKKLETELLKILMEKGVIDKREKWIRSYMGIPEITIDEQSIIDEEKKKDVAEQQKQFGQKGGFNNGNNGQDNSIRNRTDDRVAPNDGRNGSNGIPNKLKANGKVNFQAIENMLDTNEADFVRDYSAIINEQVERLTGQLTRKKIVENKDYKALKGMKIIKTDLKKLFSIYYSKLYLTGKVDAIKEVGSGVKLQAYIPTKEELAWLNRDWIDRYLKKFGDLGTLTSDDKKALINLRDKAFFITGVEEDRILKDVYFAVDEGIRSGQTTKTVNAQIRDRLLTEHPERVKYATTIARTNASDAYNNGRMNAFTSPKIAPFIEAFMYDAIIDGQTTVFCQEHNGQIIKASDPVFGTINPPNHFNCRSILVPVTVGEGEEKESEFYNYQENKPVWGKGVPEDERLPAAGFGGAS